MIEVSTLCKAVEKQDECLKILEAWLASKTYNIKEEIWENVSHVLTVQESATRHQMQHLREDVDVFYFVLMSILGRCPFVHNHSNPMIKLVNRILTSHVSTRHLVFN